MAATLPRSPSSPASDATPNEAHVLRILEKQPVCLTRVAADGTFLAVNDAALSMLGAERLDQILETSLYALIAAQHREACRGFLGRVAAGERGSMEVELTGLGGLEHVLQVHAVVHPSPQDGIVSTLCTFRDVTESRKLERALLEAAARQEEQAAAHAAERAQLSAALADTRTAAHGRSGEEQTRVAVLEQQLAEAERAYRDAADQHARDQTQLRADLAGAQQQLETTIADHLTHITQIEDTLRAAQGREQELAGQHQANQAGWQREFEAAQREHDLQLADLRDATTLLEQALETAMARERELTERQVADEAAWQQAVTTAAAEHQQQLHDLQLLFDELQQSLHAAALERDEARAERDAAHAEQQQLQAAQESERLEHQTSLARAHEQRAALDARIAALDAQAAATAGSEARHSAEREQLNDALRNAEARHEEIRAELSALAAERAALTAQLDRHARFARAGRLSLAVLADVDASLNLLTDRGRRLLLTVPDAERTLAEQVLAAGLEAAVLVKQLHNDVRELTAQPVNMASVIRRVEAVLGALLNPDVTLAVLPGTPEACVTMHREQLEQLLVTITANRRAVMVGGGQVSLELADVEIDDACGRERGAPPGAYVLLALHANGPGVDTGLAEDLFSGPAGPASWETAGPGMTAVLRLVNEAGGHLWACREGEDAIAFEIYLPKAGSASAEDAR
jgi:PAS domain S-box-containing protein